jgi:Fe-S-cluster containining protein
MSTFSPCAACGKPCCANYTVSIVGVDAWIIGKYLFLPLESFLITFPTAEHNESGFVLVPGGQRYEIALDKLGRYQKGNPCIFWISLQEGYGRCGIYPYRPLVCQTYPAYQQEEVVALRDDVYCPARSWNLMGMDMTLFRRRLYRFRMERDLYAYAVQTWNRAVEQSAAPRSLSQYYAFLMNLYERLERVRQSIPAERLQQMMTHWGKRSPGAPNPLMADLTPRTASAEWQRLLANLRDTVDGYSASWRQCERPQSRAAA